MSKEDMITIVLVIILIFVVYVSAYNNTTIEQEKRK